MSDNEILQIKSKNNDSPANCIGEKQFSALIDRQLGFSYQF